jgi:hypothetical protein
MLSPEIARNRSPFGGQMGHSEHVQIGRVPDIDGHRSPAPQMRRTQVHKVNPHPFDLESTERPPG